MLIRLDEAVCIVIGDEVGTLKTLIDRRTREGRMVGDRSVLCPFDKWYYYLEWVRGEVDASWCLLGKRVEGLVGSVWKREIETEFRIVQQSRAVCHMAEMNTWLHERQLNQMLEMRKRAVGESIIARGLELITSLSREESEVCS